MFESRDPLERRNLFLNLLYVALVIVLVGCIYFLITYTWNQRGSYRDGGEQSIAQETGEFAGIEEESISAAEEAVSKTQEISDEETQEETLADTETTQIDSEHLQAADQEAAIPVSVGKYAASQLNILVLNGSGVSGAASEWAQRLEKFGYVHVIYGNYQGERTEVTKIFSADIEKAELMEILFIEPDIEEGILEEPDYQVDEDTMSEEERKILDKVEVWIVVGLDDVQSN